mmetsp:Transcript_47849/g.95534  ORF Transcript_47849/g.95534 Transcript_47849/m.95534 type:complete len:217 (-) Transcript_47849:277-927(-)
MLQWLTRLFDGARHQLKAKVGRPRVSDPVLLDGAHPYERVGDHLLRGHLDLAAREVDILEVAGEHRHDVIERQPVHRDVGGAVAAVHCRMADMRDDGAVAFGDAFRHACRSGSQLVEDQIACDDGRLDDVGLRHGQVQHGHVVDMYRSRKQTFERCDVVRGCDHVPRVKLRDHALQLQEDCIVGLVLGRDGDGHWCDATQDGAPEHVEVSLPLGHL